MDSDQKFWLIVVGTIVTIFLVVIFCGTYTHHKNQDRLMECGKTKAAINCQCLIHSYDYCYAPEQSIK